jgi:hypothetical protein
MKKILIILFFMSVLFINVRSDIIIFNDGNTLNAKIFELKEDQIGVQTETEKYYIPYSKIKDIIYVKKIKEEEEYKQWIVTGGVILLCLLSFSLVMWGRNL